MLKRTLVFSVVMICFSVNAQNLKGLVYLDKNENGTFDNGEEGIEHMIVTNGKKIVRTNNWTDYSKKGSWSTYI